MNRYPQTRANTRTVLSRKSYPETGSTPPPGGRVKLMVTSHKRHGYSDAPLVTEEFLFS